MKNVYAVRDIQENAFGMNLMLFATDAAATRAFATTVNNPDSGIYYSNPGDFEIYQVGVYDDELGYLNHATMDFTGHPRLVVRGDSLAVRESE